MGKCELSGLVNEVRGRVGDVVFSPWKGIIRVYKYNKEVDRGNNPEQEMMRSSLSRLCRSWRDKDFKEQALWSDYARQHSNRRIGGGIRGRGGNLKMGVNAYISVNQVLVRSGFSPIEIPYLGTSNPVFPSTDLVNYGTYRGEIRFNIWLGTPYFADCRAQIWVKNVGEDVEYIRALVPISSSKIEVLINKIRVKEDKKTVEKDIDRLGRKYKLYFQFRTVARNGALSMRSALYKIQLIS